MIIGFKDFLWTFVRTTYNDDYGGFLLAFISYPFSLTNKSGAAFQITFYITIIIPLIFILYVYFKKLMEIAKVKRNKTFITVVCMCLSIGFTLLYKSAIEGQPDIIGLIYVTSIILLTIDYRFEKLEIKRLLFLALSIFCLIISRRWYSFWLVGYVCAYALYLIYYLIKTKDNKIRINIIKNVLIFCTLTMAFLLITLKPMIARIIKDDYSVSYAAWNIGGLKKEIVQQFKKLGLLYICVMLVGVIYGLKNKNLRKLTLITIIQFIITLLAFTRIQNLGDHQSLILMMAYITLFVFGIFATEVPIFKKDFSKIGLGIITFIILSNMFGAYTEKIFYGKILFQKTSLKPIIREDYDTLREMSDFILENCDEKNMAYINAATPLYCANTFQYYYLPDRTLKNYIYYESSIDSVHGFPIGVLASKYVFVSNVRLESTGAKLGHIIPYIKETIEDSELSYKFKAVKEFKMTDEVTFTAYERIVPVDIKEIEYYKEKFKEQSDLYPELFENRLNEYAY